MFTQNENPSILIDWFDDFEGENKYRFLSNFYVGEPIDMQDGNGPIYRTGEHAFQAYKASDRKGWRTVVEAKDPGRAKARGRRLTLRDDWESVKYDVMSAVLAAKFAPDRPEAVLLVMTGDALLVEGTHWGDRVWGVAVPKGSIRQPTGRNWLGRLLMAQRAILRAGGDTQHAQDPIDLYTLNRAMPKFL